MILVLKIVLFLLAIAATIMEVVLLFTFVYSFLCSWKMVDVSSARFTLLLVKFAHQWLFYLLLGMSPLLLVGWGLLQGWGS